MTSSTAHWRERAGTSFSCEKQSTVASGAMVVTNHPLASAAGMEMLAIGGNAIDAAVAALFTLSVVEPMMVGIFGGGTALLRLADGSVTVLDGLSTAPKAARPDSYTPVSDTWPGYMEVAGRANAIGASAVAAPGSLKGWCEALERHGRLDLATVIDPAIRHASRGFRASPFLSDCIKSVAQDLALDPAIAALLLPGGSAVASGSLFVQAELADTLRAIAKEGPGVLYGGAIGAIAAEHLEKNGSLLTAADLVEYRTVDRQPVRGTYRGVEIVGAPPPTSGGVHIVQMLNLLEGFDIAGLGFGTAETLHLILEAMKIAAADRLAATADPAFVTTPVERLMSKDYADLRRSEIRPTAASQFAARILQNESPNTTHVTVADREGNVVASTQTLNSVFGARILIPGTGIVPNNYMYLFDPHPGNALSLAPGKRLTSTQSPLLAYRDGRLAYALGLPGGMRLYGAAMQAILNLVDHRMSLQEAVEAPRIWTQGQEAEIEKGVPETVRAAVAGFGHEVVAVPHVAGGMCAIEFHPDGEMTGAACWRADGVAAGLSGGQARPGTRFYPDPTRRS
ncbi:gamma-glutamyltransferase 1 [Stella humosa]|uniref:Glutathione hydrolase proenzyme n=1 Tax=Stella humosa TaxID=94 RepID=A0A3N1L0M2_9PROT|nr:gamma-glutamyltransferase [Stella humosa]ROP83065.1 gamma-glutamyltransferase 1 [Stella humosa]BBK30162.1 gamma-glutamyltranspeptidase [Stella humosa]